MKDLLKQGEVDLLKYEIVDNNKEDWVVFIHGIGGSTKTWKKQVESFSKKFNLLFIIKNRKNIISRGYYVRT